jgi:hypothetical protein
MPELRVGGGGNENVLLGPQLVTMEWEITPSLVSNIHSIPEVSHQAQSQQ